MNQFYSVHVVLILSSIENYFNNACCTALQFSSKIMLQETVESHFGLVQHVHNFERTLTVVRFTLKNNEDIMHQSQYLKNLFRRIP